MKTTSAILVLLLSICDADGTFAFQTAVTHSEVVALRQPVIVKLFGAGVGNLDSYGTGVLVSKDGHVLTVWNHLVSTGFLTAVTADGQRFTVETIGTSFEHDAALLKIKAGADESFPFVDLGQAVDVEVGTSIYAFSNMFRVAAANFQRWSLQLWITGAVLTVVGVFLYLTTPLGLVATIASVVIRSPAIDAAFCRAARTTLVGSMMPLVTRFPYSPFWASKPNAY